MSIALCWALCTPLRADEALLGWRECLALARRQNPDLLSAQETVESRRNARRASSNALFPSLSLFNSYSDSDRPSPDTRWQAGGTAQWDLWNQRNTASLQSATAGLDQATAERKLQSAQIRQTLRAAYVDLLTAQEQIQTAEKIRDLRRINAETVALKYDAGREFKGNKMKAEAERAQAEAALARAQRALRAARFELNRRLGRDGDTPLSVTDPGEVFASTALFSPAGLHPRLEALAAARRSAEAALRGARSDFWPTLSANYTRNALGSTEFPQSLHWSAGATLRFPLLGGGPTAAWDNVRAARHTLRRAQADEQAGRLQIQTAQESARAAWLDAIDQVRVQRLFLQAARQRNDEATVRYAQGLISFDTWELAVTDLVQFEQSDIAARQTAWNALGQWELTQGRGLEEQ